ncbi:MAG: hypothetical protein GY903_19395 [Fuerstiella sp.]|nr:hypothetical protein [Fuerstiella sp.]MCP4856651.1 hypothetical protein [Fuerstiella sp.]
MQHSFRYLFLTGATLLTATASAAQIQHVGFQNCTDACVTVGGNNSCGNARCCQGDYCDSGRRCTLKSRHEDFCLDWCGRCGPVGRAAHQGCPTAQKICWCCKTKASCDSGWAPPARLPVNRTGGWYQSYWPNKWYGNPGGGFVGGAPMVYQPTDTTQLGYSYNRVPTWRPNPGMIPRVPSPSNFHARMCPGQSGCLTGMTRTPIIHTGGSNCPTCNPGYVNTATQRRSPQATQVAQPQQPKTTPSRLTAAQEIVPAQPITVPESYTTHAIPTAEQSTASSADNSVRPVSNTTTKKAASAGPSRPGKRVNRNSGSTRRQAKKTSGGWFGLPSLREVRF